MTYLRSIPRKIYAFARSQPVWAGIIALLVIGLAWFIFFRGDALVEETLVVIPQPLVQQVSVSGKVVAARDVDLGFTQSGRIAGVYVSVGQQVGAGTLLANIENGDQRATLMRREAALETEKAELAALRAGTRPEEVAVAESEVTSDKAKLLNSIQDAYRSSDSAVRNTADQFIDNPRNNPQLKFAVTDSQAKQKAETGRVIAETTLNAWSSSISLLSASSDLRIAAAEAKVNLAQIAQFLSDANAALNRAVPNAAVPQSTLDDYITAIGTARTNVNTSVASVTTALAVLDVDEKSLLLEQAGATAEDLTAKEAKVKAAEADVAGARAELQKTLIIAPFSGIVTATDGKVGTIASAGTSAISLISADTLQIESFVPEINVALLSVGNPSSVTLDAYGSAVPFGARVISIDPAETVRDGIATYKMILQFDTRDQRVRAGMTANVVVTTLEKQDVLQVPQGIIVERDGKKYVWVKSAEAAVEREVTTGSVSSLGNIEILSGLSAGDTIVLSLPVKQ